MEVQRTHLRAGPSDERIIDVDYCPNAQAIHHLEPIDDVVIREWGADGTLQAATLLLGRLAKGALTAKPQDVPLMRGEARLAARAAAAPSQNSHAYRETRALFNHFPRRELLYTDAAVAQDARRPHGLHVGRRRDRRSRRGPGAGYEALSMAFSDLRYSHRVEEDLKRGARRGLRPDLVQHLGRHGRHRPARLLLRLARARAPDRRRAGARASSSA